MSIVSFQNLPAHHLRRHVVGICLALLVFITLLLLVTRFPVVSTWDSTISQWTQQFRGPVTDRIMLTVTLFGDTRMAIIIVALVVIGLFSVRRWWLGLHLVCVGLSAMLSVAVIKSVIGRVRPELVNSALHTLSFPSGHACTAALVAGLLALLLAYGQNTTTRYTIYTVAALLASLIAFSRVFLLAHWPSDVIAGLALGYALIVAFAWQLHTASVLNYRYQRPLIGVVGLITVGYVMLNFSSQAPHYGLGWSGVAS